jgi:toxin ParE1/3/4
MKVEFHPRTTDDFQQAISFYESNQSGVSDLFRADLYQTIDLVADNPLLFAQVAGIRRALLKRFPYSVLYRLLDSGTVRVLAIRHHKRRPELFEDG